jgi:hypothetical protein
MKITISNIGPETLRELLDNMGVFDLTDDSTITIEADGPKTPNTHFTTAQAAELIRTGELREPEHTAPQTALVYAGSVYYSGTYRCKICRHHTPDFHGMYNHIRLQHSHAYPNIFKGN